jgi:5,10-methenyltetrahydrofolate synthetase
MTDTDDSLPLAGEYSSPPCFMHEFEADAETQSRHSDPKLWNDVMRWRRAERERLIASRLAVPVEERIARSERIVEKLTAAIGRVKDQLIGVYWPIRGEPDLRKWMADIVGAGGRIALPVVIKKGWPLEFRRWAPGDPMERGVWNILVPSHGPSVQPGVVIAPLVGFDGAKYRLGYGGGFFDRTLAAMPTRPLAIGVGYATGRLGSIYPQAHDIAMDMIITDE